VDQKYSLMLASDNKAFMPMVAMGYLDYFHNSEEKKRGGHRDLFD